MALPARFADLKVTIASAYPGFEENATRSWAEILQELEKVIDVVRNRGVDYIPQVNFADLNNLGKEELERIKKRGSVVIRDIVPDEQAVTWREELKEFVQANPMVEGIPWNDKQFFQLYWTKPQVQARSHPNLLVAIAWLNNLYHTKSGSMEGVDLNMPLSYADRFRIRKPGKGWSFFPPHVDGGGIERWEDPYFRQCFEEILKGNWANHDPFELESRINARSSLYGRPSQSSIFRTFQGWLSMSETGPTQGTLQVFPDILLSTAYIILRPFFTPTVQPSSEGIFDPKNWKFDISQSDFPGIHPKDGGYGGPSLTPALHPNLRLEEMMISVPKVNPGDAVFWHSDVVHSVEEEHTGTTDSAVMYIPAVPLTPQNEGYIKRQKECFLHGQRPPDFPKGPGEQGYIGVGSINDILSQEGRRAMGLVGV